MTKGSKKKEFKDAVEEIETVIAENGGIDGDNEEVKFSTYKISFSINYVGMQEESALPAKRKRTNSEKSSDSSARKDGKNSESDGESNLNAAPTEGPSTLKEESHPGREEPEPETSDTRTDTNNLEVDDDFPFLPNVKIVSENNLKNWIIYVK